MLECLNKVCESNKDNKCTDKLVNMQSSLTGCPIRIINYEEEYKKLKAENEILNKRNEYLTGENSSLEEQNDKTYNRNIELEKAIDSLMLVDDKYMEKQRVMEKDLIKYEGEIKKLKETIKNMAELL